MATTLRHSEALNWMLLFVQRSTILPPSSLDIHSKRKARAFPHLSLYTPGYATYKVCEPSICLVFLEVMRRTDLGTCPTTMAGRDSGVEEGDE